MQPVVLDQHSHIQTKVQRRLDKISKIALTQSKSIPNLHRKRKNQDNLIKLSQSSNKRNKNKQQNGKKQKPIKQLSSDELKLLNHRNSQWLNKRYTVLSEDISNISKRDFLNLFPDFQELQNVGKDDTHKVVFDELSLAQKLWKVARYLELNTNPAEIKMVAESFDVDGSGGVDFGEYLQALKLQIRGDRLLYVGETVPLKRLSASETTSKISNRKRRRNMSNDSERKSSKSDSDSDSSSDATGALPVHFLLQAYRRRKLVDQVCNGSGMRFLNFQDCFDFRRWLVSTNIGKLEFDTKEERQQQNRKGVSSSSSPTTTVSSGGKGRALFHRSHKCHICVDSRNPHYQKSFDSDFHKQQHLLDEHQYHGDYVTCLFCGEEWISKEDYKSHMREHRFAEDHTSNANDKGFKCEHCNCIFPTGSELSFHKKNNHFPKPGLFTCVQCHQSFFEQYQLNQHVKSQHRKQPVINHFGKSKKGGNNHRDSSNDDWSHRDGDMTEQEFRAKQKAFFKLSRNQRAADRRGLSEKLDMIQDVDYYRRHLHRPPSSKRSTSSSSTGTCTSRSIDSTKPASSNSRVQIRSSHNNTNFYL